ncbi:MAG: hypothetical protein ACE5F9_11515 [Phycisphaerae bacterium]
MIDSDHVMIHCPNGHALQARRADLASDLACPICDARFSPRADVPPQVRPISIGYAGHPLPGSVTRPLFTAWLVRLWIGVYTIQLIGSVMAAISPPALLDLADGGGTGADAPAEGALSCIALLCWIPAVALQLMWIYRIHEDARRSRAYRDVSPGLALGLSLVPAFQYPWTAWTLLRLASAAAADRRGDRLAAAAVGWARRCVVAGILIGLNGCIFGIMIGYRLAENMTAVMQNGSAPPPDHFLQQEPFRTLGVISAVISFACVVVYARTVRLVERCVYDPLGERDSAEPTDPSQ